MTFLENKKILVTGDAGFFGLNVVKNLLSSGAKHENIIVSRSRDIYTSAFGNCISVTKGVDIIIHLATTVGGIGYNMHNPSYILYDNAIMGIQLMEAARQNNVDNLYLLQQKKWLTVVHTDMAVFGLKNNDGLLIW